MGTDKQEMWEGSPDPDYAHHAVFRMDTVIGVWGPLPQTDFLIRAHPCHPWFFNFL